MENGEDDNGTGGAPGGVARTISASQGQLLFDLALDMLCVADTNGYYRHVNPAFEKILGHSIAALTRRPFVDFVHPDDREATLAEVVKLSEGQPTISFENRYLCGDGTYRWLSWRAAPSSSEGLIYAVARDVTDAKREEEERNTLLARDAYLQGRIETASGILHDLGNALTGIAMNAVDVQGRLQRSNTASDLLQRTATYLETQRPRLEVALGAVKAGGLVDLVKNLHTTVTTTRSESLEGLGKLLSFVMHAQELITTYRSFSGAGSAPQRDPVIPYKLLSDVRAMMSDTLLKRNGTITVRCERELGRLSVERSKLMQVLLNLVKNSAEAFDAETVSPPEVTLSASIVRGQGFVFEVRDNGHGFSPDEQALLFAEGFSTKARGSGLGLPSSRRVVETLGGRLELVSDGTGKGAVARVVLPMEMLEHASE